ncbi:hypothetical protein EDEG_03346 [Edhazardia aedis USNM 41457]|uniref:40S ribosomal protein S18 n=1 Tax=Edhazardia aedis (strain USNM 41457) TaxID=1003232 RepID=J8ZRA4_EDHAE|nr:hypothetical protein EDEG_03346 [Edhazardia aedis USNM 41457]|eukprot:EJW02228.1 hypothetical protein EDEG_03346 [Edhazardia aedis USNM 41457]
MSERMIIPDVPEKIQHIIRMYNTNIDGNKRIPMALTDIRGIGRRFADAIVKKAGVSVNKRAGELSAAELESIQNVISNPVEYNIPVWFLNRQRDFTDGTSSQLVANGLDACFRLYVERGKKMRHNRVCRLAAGLKVRGQRTKSNGRHGRKVSVIKKK